MRVLAISHMFPSAGFQRHGIFICRQAQALRPLGVDLYFLVGRPWVPWPLYRVRRWRSYRALCNLRAPEGLSARCVSYVRPPGLWFRRFDGRSLAWSLAGEARRWHQEVGFDAILGVSMFPDGETAVIIGRHLNLPVAALAVGSDVMVYPDRMPVLKQQLKRTLERTDLPLGVSKSICQRLADTGACRREPLCVYLSRDGAGFAPTRDRNRIRTELGWSARDVIGIYVGGLVPGKGLGDLLSAAEPLLKRGGFKLVCVGDGPLRDELEGKPGVILVGRVAPERVPSYLQASDFMVLPSHSEGLPQAILEAMDCGLAVVATRVGGIPEAVVDGQTGLLVEPGDVRQLRSAIEGMVTDESFRAAAGRHGLDRARSVFDSDRNARICAEAFKGLLA